jgi:hypothetical protein
LDSKVKMVDNHKTGFTYADLFFEWVTWVVVLVSIIAVLTLVAGFFMPKNVFILGLAITVILIPIRLKNDIVRPFKINLSCFFILGILFLALVFRADPYPWIQGGQDQGLYVNMSAYFQREGNIFIEDEILKTLPTGELRTIYSNNLEELKYRGQYQPGVYYGGDKNYVFQFYPLHPLWMSIFGDIFGNQGRFYSLTFFSLLSIFGFYMLTRALSNSQLAALSAAIILAVNPLHVFFSKFPTTEIVALAFTLIGFYYIHQAMQIANKDKVINYWYLTLSVLCMSMFFFVRITGFMYIPLLIVFLWVGIWLYGQDKLKTGIVLILFSISCLFFYILSVFYGLRFSGPYANDIYASNFGSVFGKYWLVYIMMVIGLLIFLTTIWCLISKKVLNNTGGKTSLVKKYGIVLICCILGLAIISGLHKIYMLGFSEAYISDSWYSSVWGLSGTGLAVIYRSSIINWLLYSSPFLVLTALWASFKVKWTWYQLVLFFFLSVFFVVNFAIKNWVLPYQYYYARYLLSETVPYTIILSVLIIFSLDNIQTRRIKASVIIATIVMFSYLSFLQFNAEEGRRPYEIIDQINGHVDKEDVLLLDTRGWRTSYNLFYTPLSFYHGLKVFPVTSDENIKVIMKNPALLTNGEVWLLKPSITDNENFSLESVFLHYDKIMEKSGRIPIKTIENHLYQELYLYRLLQERHSNSEYLLLTATNRLLLTQVGQRQGSYIISTKKNGFLIYGPYVLINAGRYRLRVVGEIFLNQGISWVDIVAGNGDILIEKFALQNDLSGVLLEEEITIYNKVDDMEIRIWVDDSVDFRLDFIEFYML